MRQDVSVHPAHLTHQDGTLNPEALVSFCAYQSKLLGVRQGLNFTACNKFEPVILEGQLCYSLKVAGKSKQGKSFGLLMILDPGEPIQEEAIDHTLGKDDQSLNVEDLGEERTSIKIHLNTLSPFVDFRSGSYSMSDLKKVKVNKDFLGLPELERGCQTEPFEECEVRNYLLKVITQCGCTPWVLLAQNTSEKVSY